jgi:hypothetical protein
MGQPLRGSDSGTNQSPKDVATNPHKNRSPNVLALPASVNIKDFAPLRTKSQRAYCLRLVPEFELPMGQV